MKKETLIFCFRFFVMELLVIPLILLTADNDYYMMAGLAYFVALALCVKYSSRLRHFLDLGRDWPNKETDNNN